MGLSLLNWKSSVIGFTFEKVGSKTVHGVGRVS